MLQLELFREDDIIVIRDELDKVKESNNKMRKALFARHGELAKNYVNLLERLDILEKNICLGNYENRSE